MTRPLSPRSVLCAVFGCCAALSALAPPVHAQEGGADEAARRAGFDTAVPPAVVAATGTDDPLSAAMKAAKFDPTAETLTAPLPAAVIALEASADKSAFNGQLTLRQFDLGDPDLLINLGVSGNLSDGEAPLLSLSGFENAAVLKLNAQLWHWDIGVEVDPATGRARPEVLKEEYTLRFPDFRQDPANDFETQVGDSLRAVEQALTSAPQGPGREALLANRAYLADFLARYTQSYSDSNPFFAGLQLEYGRQDFKVADLPTFRAGGAFATATEQTAGAAAQLSLGRLWGPGFALAHLRAERGYDAGSLTNVTVLLDSTDTVGRAYTQQSVYLKSPEREDRVILSAEYRYYPPGVNGRLALAPRLNWRPYASGGGDAQASLEVPAILFPDKDGNLVGGLKAVWRLDERAFGVRAFLGAKFDFFRP